MEMDVDDEILNGCAHLPDLQQWIIGNGLEELSPYFQQHEVKMKDLKVYNDLTIEFGNCFERIQIHSMALILHSISLWLHPYI